MVSTVWLGLFLLLGMGGLASFKFAFSSHIRPVSSVQGCGIRFRLCGTLVGGYGTSLRTP